MRRHVGKAGILIALFLASFSVQRAFAQAEVEPDAEAATNPVRHLPKAAQVCDVS